MSKVLDYANEMCVYQPIPFPEFEKMTANRSDCAARYDVIKENYGSFKDKTMYDLCSANCYFGFRFLQDGGKSVIAVEIDDNTRRFVNAMAEEKGLNLRCFRSIVIERDFLKYDIGLYLDTHYNIGTEGYIEILKGQCQIVFTSSCRDNDKYEALLKTMFPNVQLIHQGYQQRKVFKCW